MPEPLAGRYHGATFHPPDGSLQPARWVRRLAGLAAAAGAELREGQRIESLDELEADQVVIATDGYTHGLVPELDAVVLPTRGQVVVTAPLERRLFPCPHYARHGFDYWQQTPDGRLVAGGFRDKALDEEQTAEETTTPLIQWQNPNRVIISVFGTTEDRMPVLGPVPGRDGVWVSAGYSGHGNIMGLACGELVAQAILGEPAPEFEFFDPGRAIGSSLNANG